MTTNERKTVSVIIPVYNTEQFLPILFTALENQTYRDFEVIFIDDGTKDNSGALLDGFREKCEREQREFSVVVIHKENGGLSSARNMGLSIAKGDFVVFADSDDSMTPAYLEGLVFSIKNGENDLGCVSYSYVYKPTSSKSKQKISSSKYHEKKDCHGFGDLIYLTCKHSTAIKFPIPCFVWNKIYKRNLIGDLKFVDFLPAEDIKFNSEYIKKCKSIGFLNQKFYNYLQRKNSLSKQFDKYNSFLKRTIAEYTDVLENIENKESGEKAAAYFFGCAELFFLTFLKFKIYKIDNTTYGDFLKFFEDNYKYYKDRKHDVNYWWIFSFLHHLYKIVRSISGMKVVGNNSEPI